MMMSETTERPAAHIGSDMIRAAKATDTPALVRMGGAFFDATPLGSMFEFSADSLERFLESSLQSDRQAIMVAEVGGDVVGAIAGLVFPMFMNDSILVCQELFW